VSVPRGRGYRAVLEEMISDRVHGASWYFLRLAELLEAGVSEQVPIETMISDIRSIRPGMAPLENVAELLTQVKPLDLSRAIRVYWGRAEEGIRANSRLFMNRVKSMVTISYSSNARLFAEAVGARVVALESNPGGEGRMWGGHGGLVVPDLTMPYFIANSDAVVMGGDGLYEGFIVNKVGSLPLALTSRHLGKPVIVVLESFKARRSRPSQVYRVNVGGIEVPLFDEIPLSLVDVLITDIGVFTRVDVAYIEGKFKETILKYASTTQ